MEKTLQVLNKLEQDGVIGRYAIGGAMGALFYIEPATTYDLDIFTVLPQQGQLLTLEPIYRALREMGYQARGQDIIIEGMPVQFLPVTDDLLAEALHEAISKDYSGVPTRVMSAEHLIAICLKTGRTKDRARVQAFLDEATLDLDRLSDILKRHNLEGQWKPWAT